jgi:N-acetyl-anhydromuramyl-L-alanine amidase AmpD
MTDTLSIPFVQARHYTKHVAPRRIDLIVIHVTQNKELPGIARGLAGWAAGNTMPPGKEVSWGYIVDSAGIIQSVNDNDIAWHTGRVNPYSIGIEHVGMSQQTTAEWADAFSTNELTWSARLVALLCTRHSVPAQRVALVDIASKQGRGICGHWDITNAFHIAGGHTDPGPKFPWNGYMNNVAHYFAAMRDESLKGADSVNATKR